VYQKKSLHSIWKIMAGHCEGAQWVVALVIGEVAESKTEDGPHFERKELAAWGLTAFILPEAVSAKVR